MSNGTGAETTIPLPPLVVTVSNLQIVGAGAAPTNIIQADEAFTMSLDIAFTPSPHPFVNLLMGIPLDLTVSFESEGYGPAPEIELVAPVVHTALNTYNYTVSFTGAAGPAAAGLTVGVYELAATVSIAGLGIPIAVGHSAEIIFQVY